MNKLECTLKNEKFSATHEHSMSLARRPRVDTAFTIQVTDEIKTLRKHLARAKMYATRNVNE